MLNDQKEEQFLQMPIKVTPYKHQYEAFIFALQVMGVVV